MTFEKMWTNREKPTVSIELFPQKGSKKQTKLYEKLKKFGELDPDFISVTFGAGGSTRTGSLELIREIKKVFKKSILAYFAGYGLSRQEIKQVMDNYRDEQVDSVLCVRGDEPEGPELFTKAEDCFNHAGDLVSYISERYSFPLGVAGYPEGHKECIDLRTDLDFLKQKVDRGAKFIISQYFYENIFFYKFRDRCRKAGITIPIIAGIMPIYNIKVMENLSNLCGTAVTLQLKHGLRQIDISDRQAVNEFGIGFAVEQCRDLIKNGVDGIHFYTMDRTRSVTGILTALRAGQLI